MIYLIRHGQTEYNLNNIVQGSKNSDLTELGKNQAKMVSELLRKDYKLEAPLKTYVSPMGRTVETSNILAQTVNMNRIYDETIKEVCFGEWEGENIDELCKRYPFLKNGDKFVPDWYFNSPGGESLEHTQQRANQWLKKVENENNVCAVTHGLFGRIVIGLYTGLDNDTMLSNYMKQGVLYKLDNGQLQVIE